MGTSGTNLSYLLPGQEEPEVTVNGDLDQIDSVITSGAVFAWDRANTSWPAWHYFGGNIFANGANVAIAAGSVTLVGSSTNYIQRTSAGVVSINQTGFTAGYIPIATVVTGSSSITSVTDSRPGVTNYTTDLAERLTVADLFGDFIVSGIIGAPVTGLSLTLPAGVAYILGQRTTPAAYTHTYAASTDNYIDLKPDGTYTVASVANGAAEPAVTSGAVRTQVIVTSATDVTGVTRRLRAIPHVVTGSELGGPYSTTSSTNSRIGTLSVPIEITSSYCEVFAKCVIQKTGTSANAALYVARDGTQVGEMAEIIDLSDTQFHVFIAAFLDSPGPGSHTYEFWWGVDGGSTDTLSTVTSADARFTRSISVREVLS